MYGLLAGVCFWGGVYFYGSGDFSLGTAAYFVGILVSTAGFFGIFYKVISDAVYTGLRNAGASDLAEVSEGSRTRREDPGELDLSSTYDEENEVLKVTVNNPGGADYLDIIVDGEVRETLRSPEPGEETTVDKKPSESIEVKRREYGR